MAKHRSPNYPQVTLEEACERARKVYIKEHTHETAREIIFKDLGYSGLNGAALTAISTLRQYGLLVIAGEGLRISEDAVSVFELPDGEPEKCAALRRLAFTPSLFAEFHDIYGDNPPSDGSLRHLLIKNKKFLPNAAEIAVRIYRENLDFIRGIGPSYNGSERQRDIDDGVQKTMPTEIPQKSKFERTPTLVGLANAPGPSIPLPDDSSVLVFRISRDSEAKVALNGQVTQEAIKKLIVLLETSIDTYPTIAELEREKSSLAFTEDSDDSLDMLEDHWESSKSSRQDIKMPDNKES